MFISKAGLHPEFCGSESLDLLLFYLELGKEFPDAVWSTKCTLRLQPYAVEVLEKEYDEFCLGGCCP